ncbi:MAG: tetratricopeptide repeat protein [Verrucomicrobiota bacterium]
MSRTLDDPSDRNTFIAQRRYNEFLNMLGLGRSFSGFERNCCYLNTGGGRFANISAVSGVDFPDDGRGVALVDWDHDGDLDVWSSNRNAPRLRFLRNQTPGDRGSILIRLVGTGPTTPRDAIGARVERVSSDPGGLKQIKTLKAGEGFLAQSSKWLHFGTGRARGVERIRVRWPGGDEEWFPGGEAGGRYVLEQGKGEVTRSKEASRSIALKAGPPEPPETSGAARTPLVTRLPMLNLPYTTFEGEAAQLPAARPLLVNLWASWCMPCVAEMKEWSREAKAIRAAGLDIVSLAVNGVGEDRSSPEMAQRLVRKLKFPFTSGRATEPMIHFLQALYDALIARRETIPVPVSFLVDAENRVSVIYKGRVSVDQLLADAKSGPGTPSERLRRSALLPGRSVEHELVSYRPREINKRLMFADQLQRMQWADAARAEYEKILHMEPEHAITHNNLAIGYARQRRLGPAERHFKEALRIKADYGEAHSNLGLVYDMQGRLNEARTHYEAALKIMPTSTEVIHNYGKILMKQKQWDAARAQFNAALAINPRLSHVYVDLGMIQYEQGAWREAEASYQKALVMEPRNQAARQNLSLIQQWIRDGKKPE